MGVKVEVFYRVIYEGIYVAIVMIEKSYFDDRAKKIFVRSYVLVRLYDR